MCNVQERPTREIYMIRWGLSKIFFHFAENAHYHKYGMSSKGRSISNITRSRYTSSYKIHKVLFPRFSLSLRDCFSLLYHPNTSSLFNISFPF